MHCSEALAFWLFIEILESCSMRAVYEEGLPGLLQRQQDLDELVKKQLPEIHYHLQRNGMDASFYASKWMLSLFQSNLPLENFEVSKIFFGEFLTHNWRFFNRLALEVIKELSQDILKKRDIGISVLLRTRLTPLEATKRDLNYIEEETFSSPSYMS
jgi:hypothetical protein